MLCYDTDPLLNISPEITVLRNNAPVWLTSHLVLTLKYYNSIFRNVVSLKCVYCFFLKTICSKYNVYLRTSTSNPFTSAQPQPKQSGDNPPQIFSLSICSPPLWSLAKYYFHVKVTSMIKYGVVSPSCPQFLEHLLWGQNSWAQCYPLKTPELKATFLNFDRKLLES